MSLCGADVWGLRRTDERFLETTEMRMLRRMNGVALRDIEMRDKIRKGLGMENVDHI